MVKREKNSKVITRSPQLLILIALLLLGCEKIIDVDLNEANPEIVIEANLTNLANFAEVKLTKTGSYFGDSPIENISGASVIVEDEFGKGFILNEVDLGLYRAEELLLKEETTYRLSIDVDGEKYESTSKLNTLVKIDSLAYVYDEGFAFLDEGYILKLYFTDPPNHKNYYRIKIFKQDTILYEYRDIIVFDDRLIEGQAIEATLRETIFEVGDTVTVEFVTLDKGAYEYLNTFQELINVNPGSAAPANPTSNISNGALGYFSAWSADTKTVIIEE